MMPNERIYLDYNATTPLRSAALESMQNALSQPLNASSIHAFGQMGRKIVEDSRTQVAALINIPAAQLIFNSGATEGNNTVLKYFSGERVLVSAIEHPSVLEASPKAEHIPATPDGLIDLQKLEALLNTGKTPALVSVMLVNNETGVIQPIKDISALAKKYGALMHCDTVQAAGRIPVDMTDMDIDFLTLSSHKIGGPQGIGALALGICGITPTLLQGGGQEKYARAGTENVAGIAGFGAAAEDAETEIGKSAIDLRAFEKALLKIHPGTIIHGQNAPRVSNTTLFSVPGLPSETALMALDLDGIAVSNGSACSSGSIKTSHVLNAMNVDNATAKCALRVSTGWHTSQKDLDRFLESWTKICKRIR